MLLRFSRPAWYVALALLAGTVSANDQTVQDKKDAEAFVRAIYAKRIREIESPQGRDEVRRSCDYLRSVFDAPLLKGDTLGCDAPARFPDIDPYEILEFREDNKLPASRIVGSSVKDGTAIVKVQAPIIKDRASGRVVYYLKKANGRWRVSNMLTYQHWPIDTNQEGGCRYVSGYYQFALPPKSEADLEDLPSACKALELDNIRRLGPGASPAPK